MNYRTIIQNIRDYPGTKTQNDQYYDWKTPSIQSEIVITHSEGSFHFYRNRLIVKRKSSLFQCIFFITEECKTWLMLVLNSNEI